MYHIQNDRFSAGIRAEGAELASLRDLTSGREWIWQADPTVWGSSAPILFPIVGFLKEGATRIEDSTYPIPKHGILRGRKTSLLELQENTIRLGFTSDAGTLALYPYPFEFEVSFHVCEDGLDVRYQIHNPGSTSMLFSVGSHPAFALDLSAAELSDYTIQFSEPETLDLYGLEDNLLVLKQEGYLTSEREIPLSASLFEQDALIFQHIQSRRIRLVCDRDPVQLEMEIGEAPHLGLWAKPGAPYVCIEPWFTYNDAADSDGQFEHKPGIMTLLPGSTFETGYQIRIL